LKRDHAAFHGATMAPGPDLTHAFLALMLIGSILLVGGLLFLAPV
jgi:hypothetical protein